MKNHSLEMALSKVLFKYEPKLLVSDSEATAHATAALVSLLGCVLASILIKHPNTYKEALRIVMSKINDTAMKTAVIAQREADKGPPTKH